MGISIALVVRLIVPLTILRWPLAGGLLSIAADTCDILIFNIWGFPPWDYQRFDKALDVYYLTLELLVVQRWLPAVGQPWLPFERSLASALFAYRLAGILLFEATGWRPALLLFPNLFEVYYLLVLGLRLVARGGGPRLAPAYPLTPRRTFGWLAILLLPKLAQEYLLHAAKVLDDLVLFDVISDLWP